MKPPQDIPPTRQPIKTPQVAVLVDTSTGWGRRMIRGIHAYAKKHGPWHLQIEARGRKERFRLATEWSGDGVIARISNPSMAEQLKLLGVPAVNVSAIKVNGYQFPTVTHNYPETGALAASHFIERGFKNFAYVGGPLRHDYIQNQLEAVRDAVYIAEPSASFNAFDYRVTSVSERGWSKQNEKLRQWILEQPRPLAVIGWAAEAAIHVLDLCQDTGLAVPDDIAVLASGDDDLLCESTHPPVSGLVVASEQVGYRAAVRLDAMMKGRGDTGETERIAPIEINTRGSTETFAIEDKELLRAIIFLRQNAYGPLTVQEVADAVPMTRRSLERKFKFNYGRTPLSELHRLRIARAKQLLAQTDYPISQVAEASGFGSPKYLATRFAREVGIPPLRYRSMIRTQ